MTLLIIGAGPGGYECALRAARLGLNVTLIDDAGHLGGTCLTEGCIPTKCLCHTADMLRASAEARMQHQVPACGSDSFDLAAAVARKNKVVATLQGGIQAMLDAAKINFVKGKARFVPGKPRTVQVEGTQYAADYLIIAIGSTTKYLPIPGARGNGILTSTEMLNLTTAPRRLCIIGGGVIGLEFASIFHAFGSQVSVVEFCKEILPNFDRDIAKRLRTSLKKQGVAFSLGAVVTAIEPQADGSFLVKADAKGKETCVEADSVLMAVGRAANLESLNLDEAGIAYTRRGITVDENMETNMKGVYAIGDVNGICQLAHAATFQGYRALEHIVGQAPATDLGLVPAAVFTVPEVAMVGLTEEMCNERGIAYQTRKAFFRANGKALSMNADEGIVKILTDTDGHILGAHILGAHASDLIHELTLAMRLGAPLSTLATTIHAHPSLSEVIMQAAEQ